MSDRQARRLITVVRSRITADWIGVERKAMTAEILSQLSEIHNKAMQGGNLCAALGALNSKTKLIGL